MGPTLTNATESDEAQSNSGNSGASNSGDCTEEAAKSPVQDDSRQVETPRDRTHVLATTSQRSTAKIGDCSGEHFWEVRSRSTRRDLEVERRQVISGERPCSEIAFGHGPLRKPGDQEDDDVGPPWR